MNPFAGLILSSLPSTTTLCGKHRQTGFDWALLAFVLPRFIKPVLNVRNNAYPTNNTSLLQRALQS